MSGERRLRILGLLAEHEGSAAGEVATGRLCDVGRTVSGVTGAGIMLMSGDLPLGSMCTTDAVSARIETLQYTLGEGPCVDAYHLGRPVLEPDLAHPAVRRWAAFSGPAVEAGARAVFGFPMVVGGVRLGALNLYRDRVGELTDDQHANALVMADVAAESVLAMEAEGSVAALAAGVDRSSHVRFVVHQAAGMVSVQLDVSVAHALLRLRSYAFARQRPLADVAGDVVARRLCFSEEDG